VCGRTGHAEDAFEREEQVLDVEAQQLEEGRHLPLGVAAHGDLERHPKESTHLQIAEVSA
jgi:hypothetical protein